jgi:23S rRNA (uracil1939-C5)-methyltransferase
MPINDILEFTPTTLAYGGDAFGRVSSPSTGAGSRAIFVPFALPGETVRVRILEEKRGFSRAELVEVVSPSPQRIAPRCRHFASCGGCHYQHMPYAAQLAAKEGILRDQLQRIGKIESPPVKPIIPSPAKWNYRNHIQFHLSEKGKLGFMGTAGGILPVTECHLPEPVINALWPQMEFEPGTPLERISIRKGEADDIMLVLETEEARLPEMEIEADISVVHLNGDDAVVMAGDDHVVMVVNERRLRVSAGSFFQVNTAMAGKMISHLLERLPLSKDGMVVDAYCGVGLFSAFLAPHVGRLIGIESSASACEDFAINLDEFDHVELYEAPAEDVLPHLDARPNVVLVDPPRAGLERHALDAIVTMDPQTIAYVSCDPATLARDAARMISGGYRLVEVTPFDLFPQTYHIESISIFENNEDY